MVRKGIATLASAAVLCFLLLSHFDPQFFLMHLYESLIFLTIVVMLFYFEDRWAYMLGMLVPLAWLALTFVIGAWSGFFRQVQRVVSFERPDFAANLLGAIVVLLCLLMVIACGARWRREFAGLGKGWKTFWICLGVTSGYYAVLVIWILWWTPTPAV